VAVVIAAVAAFLVANAHYLIWTARRLDRMHRRLDAAAFALDAQLRSRADASAEFAARRRGARELAAAAAEALAVTGLDHDREAAESALSRALQERDDLDADLAVAVTRTTFARRFHNDAVRDALVVRRRRVVRYLRLAGSARLPTFFEMDDVTLERTIEV
jgi:hypothetical protein